MKYRDVVMFFISIAFILSLAYTLGVNSSYWYIPVILLIITIILFYKLWIEK
jgi:hypothetical protein